jgi:hypothetical protein
MSDLRGDKLSCTLNIRFTAKERSDLMSESKRLGVSVGELIRRKVFKRQTRKNHRTDSVSILIDLGNKIKQKSEESSGESKLALLDSVDLISKFVDTFCNDRKEDTV